MGYTSVRKCIHIEIKTKFNLIHEKEWIGETISNICKRYGVSRKTYYKWNNRYKQNGIGGLLDVSKRPHKINYRKITSEVEETILDLRLGKRFGCNRIKFRLRKVVEISLSTRTIYKILKRHGLNILKCQYRRRRYKRFAMKHPNDMVQMGSVDVLNVIEDWIIINGKPRKIMHDNGKQFTSKMFRHFLIHNQIKDKQIPNSYPQLQGKIEAYNKVVNNEFLAVEAIPNIDEGKQRYDMFVKAYNETREHGGINGLTPSEMFLQRLITSSTYTRTKQQSVTHVGN